MSKLVCKELKKKFKDTEALRGVNLELESGKIYGLIGRNGAGKTTLLSILSGQMPASSGTAALDGERIWENRRALDRICFSRELNLASNAGVGALKIRDYLRTARLYFPNWSRSLETELVQLFGIPLKKQLCRVNKGMQSMVTITVALASRADFTFLDEPVAGLDVVAREQFYKLLLDEFAETGRTFVISTHIIEEAAGVFEETIIVDRGALLCKRNTEELVGSARLVSGHADQVDAAVAGLETHHCEQLGRSKTVTVLLRPGQELNPGYDVDVRSVNLQKVFVALCGEEG